MKTNEKHEGSCDPIRHASLKADPRALELETVHIGYQHGEATWEARNCRRCGSTLYVPALRPRTAAGDVAAHPVVTDALAGLIMAALGGKL